MAFSGVGFNGNVAEAHKRNQKIARKMDDDISSMLKSHSKKLRTRYDITNDVVEQDDSFSLARRITIKPGTRVEPEILLELKQLQEHDQEIGHRLLPGMLRMSDKDSDITTHTPLMRCAVRAMLEEYCEYPQPS